MRNGRLFTIVGGIFGLIGLVLLCVGIALAASTAGFLASAGRTDGRVAGLTARTSTTRSSDATRTIRPTRGSRRSGRRSSLR
ncbi:hypothetical protein ACIBO5_39795 [Nonomuraea angiospora]|uniref:hypothetical protein n=1 Tax=Nonomuraea angiospora TaxID=46172 RepID=UPI003793DB5C